MRPDWIVEQLATMLTSGAGLAGPRGPRHEGEAGGSSHVRETGGTDRGRTLKPQSTIKLRKERAETGILPDPAEEDEEDGPEGELIGVRRPHRRRSAIQVRWQARGGRTTPRELESEQYTIG